MTEQAHQRILAHYDACLARHGDTAQGADWPDEAARRTRFDIMLDLIPPGSRKVSLCDLACGTGELLSHIERCGLNIAYTGADLSAHALELARTKFPGARFIGIDVLSAAPEELAALSCDYMVMNGLFTVKADLTHDQMWAFMTGVIERVWPLVSGGLAFNVMSSHVDWERDDLFHVPFDKMAAFLHGIAGRQIAFRADYGLYEHTCYVYKTPYPRNR